jgi:hypothetical protein
MRAMAARFSGLIAAKPLRCFGFVVSGSIVSNLQARPSLVFNKRRSLRVRWRAALALEYVPILAVDAERRKLLGGEKGRAVQRGEVGFASPDAKPEKDPEKKVTHQAAKVLLVSRLKDTAKFAISFI